MISGQERTVYPDRSDWRAWITPVCAVVALAISLLGGVRLMTTQTDLQVFRETYLDPLRKDVDELRKNNSELGKELGGLSSDMKLVKREMEHFGKGQERIETTQASTLAELKRLIEQLSNKLERYQQGRTPAPQGWWDDDWHLQRDAPALVRRVDE